MSSVRVKEAISEGYVDWALFLSSYSPLPLLLAVRLWGKSGIPSIWLGLATVVMMLPLLHVLKDLRSVGGRKRELGKVSSTAGEIAGYIAGYILPLIVLDSIGLPDYIAYILFIW